MRRVLLVNTNVEKAPYPVPPVGVCLLASALDGRYELKVYDGVFGEGRGLQELVLEFEPAFVGFSIRNIDDVIKERTIFYIDGILEKFIRPVREVTGVPFILGGSGFSIFPDELLTLTGADYGIIGEAVDLLPLLLDRLSAGESPAGIPNVVVRGNRLPFAAAVIAPASSKFSEIDRWIDFDPYRAKGVYSIQTKRGCSHGCIYCTYPMIEGKSFRPRDPSDVADEIEQARDRLGDVTFEFVDSTFNDPEGHAEAICRELIRRKIDVRLRTMGINPRNASEELFELMVQAGFRQIDATPDSASPAVLRKIGKGFGLPAIQRMARLIRQFDLPTMWFFLFGGPGENESTFLETLSFIDTFINPLDLVFMSSGMRIYPNTPLHRIALREGSVHPGESLLYPPRFYAPRGISFERLDSLIVSATQERFNCVPAWQTSPSADMIAKAIEMRKNGYGDEPMFRTLLRVRKARMQADKM